ncbi:MAG: CPBP family intramembrane glutamic endopeptidase [Planctomycetota bacterium]
MPRELPPAPNDADPEGAIPPPPRRPDFPDEWAPVTPDRATRLPDPGTRPAATMALVILVVIATAVAALQQLGGAPGELSTLDDASAPGLTLTDKSLKLFIKISEGSGMPETMGPALTPQIIYENLPPHDQIRSALALATLSDATSGLTAIDAAEEQIEQLAALPPAPDDDTARDLEIDYGPTTEELNALRTDIEQTRIALEAVRLDGASLDAVPDTARDWLLTRYGWHAEVLLTTDESRRSELVSGGGALMLLLLGFGAFVCLLLIVGLAVSVMALVQLSQSQLRQRFIAPVQGGSVYLETAAVFVVAFLGVQIVGAVLAAILGASGASESATLTAILATQWLLVLVPLWPLVRGVSFSRLRQDLGLHSGEGVLKELGAGIVGYLAGVPLYAAAVLIGAGLTIVSELLRQMGAGPEDADAPPELPDNSLFDTIAGSSVVELALLVSLATIWAPLVEELVFRGALFRHMRSRIAWPLAAIGSAFVFAIMHGYGIAQLIPVAALGITFGAMRQWRDSLIAPIFAHFLHNATLIALMVVVFRVLL